MAAAHLVCGLVPELVVSWFLALLRVCYVLSAIIHKCRHYVTVELKASQIRGIFVLESASRPARSGQLVACFFQGSTLLTVGFAVKLPVLADDQSCTTAEGDEGPRPTEDDKKSVAETGQKKDVYNQPHDPREETGETKLKTY